MAPYRASIMDQPLGPLFVPPGMPDRFWILILLVAVPVMLASLLVMVRGRLPAVLSSMAFLLLPPFAYVLGDIHLLEESKHVAFCGSCHETMSPLIAALKESPPETLAAIHYQRGRVSHVDACYQCHSGYGLWGDAHAKTAGVMHMLNTVLGNYDYPLEARAFSIDSCRNCHAAAENFRAVDAHQDPDMQQALLAGEMSCAGMCHPAAHPDWALNGAQALAAKAP